jgi:ectoine hydroxylase-related dioxygenase (phytanoyl-CoA dioxygenase family)
VTPTYADDGFVLRPKLLRADTLRSLTAIVERVHRQWLAANAETARRDALVNSSSLTSTRWFPPPFEAERRAFFDALAAPELHDIVTAALGADVYFHGTQLFFDPLGPRRPYWHRDLQYLGLDEDRQRALLGKLRHFHVRIPLRPERRFLLVPGSHARWDTGAEYDVRLERDGHGSHEDLPTARAFDLDPGDVLLFSAHMLHRGTYDGNPQRLSLDLMVGEPHPDVSIERDPDELPTEHELAGIRRPSWYRRAHALHIA